MPYIGIDVRHRVASIRIDKLDVEIEGDTLLILNHILTDQLTGNVYRSQYTFICECGPGLSHNRVLA